MTVNIFTFQSLFISAENLLKSFKTNMGKN